MKKTLLLTLLCIVGRATSVQANPIFSTEDNITGAACNFYHPLRVGPLIHKSGRFNTHVYHHADEGISASRTYEYRLAATELVHPNIHGILYVDSAAASGGDGSSWGNAISQLADALKATDSLNKISPGTVKQIWVARGTYKPLYAPAGETWNGQSLPVDGLPVFKTFLLPDSIKMYGGFAGTEASLNDRDTTELFTSNATILSGDISEEGNQATAGLFHVILAIHVDSAQLDGLTISGAHASTIGSYDLNGESVSAEEGGGILCYHSSLRLTHLQLTGNWAGYGGAISSESNSSLTIAHVIIQGNIAAYAGGGIYNNHSTATLDDVTLNGNMSVAATEANGGGIANENHSSLTLTGVTISGSIIYGSGGGLFNADSSSAALNNVMIKGNLAEVDGGGIYNDSGTLATLNNVVIAGNRTVHNGGGIYNKFSSPSLTNVTISANISFDSSGAMYNLDNSNPTLANCIVYGNTTEIVDTANSHATVTYSLVQGMAADPQNHLLDGSLNPLFVDSATGNYQLQATSPVIDKGINDSLPAADTIDLAGNPRIYDKAGGGIVDLGAYEFEGSPGSVIRPDGRGIMYVDSAAAPGGDGTSWKKALQSFGVAMHAGDSINRSNPAPGDSVRQIWVAKGTYQPADGQYFSMLPHVKIYGGFAGRETSLSERDLKAGDSSKLKGNGSTVIVNDNNGLDTSSVLDGFTITGGTGGNDMGGGMYNNAASPTISNCIFTDNQGSSGGSAGAMYNRSSSPEISNCIFSYNSSADQSGGIMIEGGKPVITNCLFIHNASPDYGGALWSSQANPVIINCTFAYNTAGTGLGNAIFLTSDTAHLYIANCVIWDNLRPGQQSDQGISTLPSAKSEFIVITHSTTQGYGSDTAGNKTSDPLFRSPATGDYSLQQGSPAINAGDNTVLPNGDTTDLDDNQRIISNVIDMGAYEYQGEVDSTRITAQPKDSTICAGDGVSFAVSATGAAISYQWQRSANQGTSWENAPGSNHPVIQLSDVPASDSGNQYRVIVSGSWGSDTSGVARLLVNTPPSISTPPKDTTVSLGDDASFSVGATGSITGYQWQVSTDGTTWNDLNGASGKILTIPRAGIPLSGNRYRAIVTGICQNDTSTAALLTVTKPVLILTPPSLPVGYTNLGYPLVVFSAEGGTSPYSYAETGILPEGLRFSDGTLSGTPTQAGSFPITVKVTDHTSGDLGGPLYVIKKYTILINNGGSCIAVSSYPADEVACEGGSVIFSISATGAATYQWQSFLPNGSVWESIPGATGSSLQVSDVSASEDGTKYRAIVGNPDCGNLTTPPVTLTVHAVTHTTLKETICAGDVYTIGNHHYTSSGTYTDTLRAHTGCDSIIVLHLTVNNLSAITAEPADLTVALNKDTSFSVQTTGTVSGYQWQSSGNGGASWGNVRGGSAETLELLHVSASLNGYQYRVIVKGSCHDDTSRAARLMVDIPVTWDPPGDTLPTGYEQISYTDTVKASDGTGSVPIYHEKGKLPPGLTFDPSTGVLSGTPAESGSYPVVVTATFPAGQTDTTYSERKDYTIVVDHNGACVDISLQPESQTTCTGGHVTFRVRASNATGYQWQSSTNDSEWKDIPQAVSDSLTLRDVLVSQSGNAYRAVVSSACGSVPSAKALLTVHASAAINSGPQSRSVCVGETVSFQVEATGSNISYQWQNSTDGATWTNMDGKTSKTLEFSDVSINQSGMKYRTIVSGHCSALTSEVATLTVNPVPEILITADQKNPVSKGLVIHLTASGANTYQWAGSPGIQDGWGDATLTIRPEADATYSVTGISAEGCKQTLQYPLQIVTDYKLICNNTVSPNGDGKNDTWIIRNIDSYPNNKVMIFDRAARMVYEKNHYDNQWSGMLNGGPLHEGTYYYVFIVDGGKKIFKGYIELLNGKR